MALTAAGAFIMVLHLEGPMPTYATARGYVIQTCTPPRGQEEPTAVA